VPVSEARGAGAQRELELNDVRKVLPWGGQSPRVLTSAYARFRFAPEGMTPLYPDVFNASPFRDKGWSDPDQLLLFIGGNDG